MRELLDGLNNTADDLEVHAQKEQEQKFELVLEQQIFPHKGHTLFEINVETHEIQPAQYNLQRDYLFDWNWKLGDPVASHSSLIKNAGCVYISALNKAQAMKKFYQGGSKNNGSKFTVKGSLKLF